MEPSSRPRRSLLAVMTRAPWPARKNGFALRYFPILRYLGTRHHVDLIVLEGGEAPFDENLLPGAAKVDCLDLQGSTAGYWRRTATVLRGMLPRAAPYAFRHAWADKIVDTVLATARSRDYDAFLWAGPEHLEALAMLLRHSPAPRCVVDFIDSPTLIASGARKRVRKRGEMAAIVDWERRLRSLADVSIYISPRDAAAAESDAAEGEAIVLPNGVFLDDFQKGASGQFRPEGLPERYILFFGHMSFEPNVDAVQWLCAEIMPRLWRHHPDLALVIAGHQPSQAVQDLSGAGTIITGSVDSMWPYIQQALACVFPLRLAAGLQNKILEALSAEKVVVTTPRCAESLGAEGGRHLMTAETAEEFSDAVLAVINDPVMASRLGSAGLQLVRNKFDWNALNAKFEKAILGASP